MPIKLADTDLQNQLRRYASYFSAAVAVIATLVLIGWAFDVIRLRRPITHLVAMNPLTACLFILFAIAHQIQARTEKPTGIKLSVGIASVILLIATCKLADVFCHINLNVDQILFPVAIDHDIVNGMPNRMAPNAAMAFFFLAIALILQPFGKAKGKMPAQYAVLPVTLIAFFALLGYLYKVPAFYGVLNYIPMALSSAFCFLLSALAILAVSPDRGVMRAFTTVFSGSQTGRYLVPAVIIVPAVLGYLRLVAEGNLKFPVAFGVAMLVIGIMAALLALVGYHTVALNAKDALQRETQIELELLNRELEARVEKRTAQALRNQMRLNHVMDNMLEGVQIIDFGWKFLYVNAAIEKQSQLSKDKLVGKIVTDLYPVSENLALFTVLQLCMKDRMPQHLETGFKFPDGRSGWFEMSIQPIPEGIFILTMDITDRKLAEEQVLRANADLENKVQERTSQLQQVNQELESFCYSVSHDLRAPLRTIDGFVGMLAESSASTLSDESKKLLAIIQGSAVRMDALIGDILKLSQLGVQTIDRRPVDMNRLVGEVLSEIPDLADGKVDIRVNVLHAVEGDYALLRQVFINLLSNAVKYAGKNAAPLIEVSSEEYPQEIIYSVRDNGVGFDMKYADKLFGVFQRLHSASEFEGTGVGLAIVQRVVHRHGGRVWAEAEVGKGARFSLALPRRSFSDKSLANLV